MIYVSWFAIKRYRFMVYGQGFKVNGICLMIYDLSWFMVDG
jgi:hypothetical protein